MSETEAEKLRIEFEREKWRDDVKLKERELLLKEREIGRSRWSNPLVVAVLAAAVAAAGNALVVWITSQEQHRLENERAEFNLHLEENKAEAARILEVIHSDPDRNATNLAFLMETGLISNEKIKKDLAEYLRKRKPGQGPSIAPSTGSISFDQMKQIAIVDCTKERSGQPDAPRFCRCWVDTWVSLWSAQDQVDWLSKGAATPHMREMEGLAAARCKQ